MVRNRCPASLDDLREQPNVAVQALVQARSEAEREARVACNRWLGCLPIEPAVPHHLEGR